MTDSCSISNFSIQGLIKLVLKVSPPPPFNFRKDKKVIKKTVFPTCQAFNFNFLAISAGSTESF
jgi:hypothetical protein